MGVRKVSNIKSDSARVLQEVDLAELARVTDGFSGADVAVVCKRAIQLAIAEAVEILVINIHSVVRATFAKLTIIFSFLGFCLLLHMHRVLKISLFAARRYVSTVYAVIVCLSVRPSVCHKLEFYKDG